MRYLLVIAFTTIFLTLSTKSYSWSKKGHELVAEIAFHFLDDSLKARVQRYLGKETIEEASVWMDEMRSNSYYDYMKTWHYINIEKGESYKPSAKDRDIIIILNSCIHELNHKENLKSKNISEDLNLLFHLMGDLHQPLHVGYGIDRGGNDTHLSYLHKSFSTNLHSVWDDEIIETKNITLEDCLKHYNDYTPDEINDIQKIDLMNWMKQSRSLLDTVYNFENNFIDQNYVDTNSIIIEKQILKAGLRLAAILKQDFKD